MRQDGGCSSDNRRFLWGYAIRVRGRQGGEEKAASAIAPPMGGGSTVQEVKVSSRDAVDGFEQTG